jgi:hypothetical protein
MWRYALFDYDAAGGQDVEEWMAELTMKGWQPWSVDGQRSGTWIHVDGRRVWWVSLRRWDPDG